MQKGVEKGPGLLARVVGSAAGRALIALLLVFALGAIADVVRATYFGNDDFAFFKLGTHRDALRQVSVCGILACGMCLVIVAGGIDLAVGSVLGLVAMCFSLMLIDLGWSPWLAIPACLAVGAACGGVSGTLTAVFGIQPFIATLAMMVFARGLAKSVSGGEKISMVTIGPDGALCVPKILRLIDTRILGDRLSVVTLVFLVCAAFTWVALARHRWGRQLYAIGGNEQAARLSGISVRKIKILAYAASGVMAAVAGICQAAQEQQGDPEAGFTYELTAIAIVVIGGTSLMGGSGGIGLTLIGTLTIGYLEKILSINAVPEAWRQILTGVIIVAAVLAQKRRH